MSTLQLSATVRQPVRAKVKYVLRWIGWGIPITLRRWARLDKTEPNGDVVTYHLRQDWRRVVSCSCRGYSVHGSCKHARHFQRLFDALPQQEYVDTARDMLAVTTQPLDEFDAA